MCLGVWGKWKGGGNGEAAGKGKLPLGLSFLVCSRSTLHLMTPEDSSGSAHYRLSFWLGHTEAREGQPWHARQWAGCFMSHYLSALRSDSGSKSQPAPSLPCGYQLWLVHLLSWAVHFLPRCLPTQKVLPQSHPKSGSLSFPGTCLVLPSGTPAPVLRTRIFIVVF